MLESSSLATQHSTKELLINIGIVVFAAIVRLVYLYQIAATLSFDCPIVDARTYDQMARSLAAGHAMTPDFFWQPFFYPLFLSLAHLISSGSILFAKLAQLTLSCATCLLTYHLGKRIFDRPTGIIAAVITALYGPLIFFELELLACGWAAFWSVVLIILLLPTASSKNPWLCLAFGASAAVSILTRPTFAPFLLAAVIWLIVVFCRSELPRRPIALRLALIAGGFLTIVLPVAAQNYRITGHFALLPASGGINLYIGNNPDSAQTRATRPGWGWEDLRELPKHHGVYSDWWGDQKFFKEQVAKYVVEQPLSFIAGLAQKTLQFLNSREIPRNVDVYLFTQWSPLLALLTWKSAGFGFPFGLLLPLALLGLLTCWRRIPTPFLLFVILYPASIILVFVTARYRVPVIPALAILAAAGLLQLFAMFRHHHWRRCVITILTGIGIVLLSTLPGPFIEEQPNFQAEYYRNLGIALTERGQPHQAMNFINKALQLQPDYPSAHLNLGVLLAQTGQNDLAINHYYQALRIKPDYATAHNNIAIIHANQGQHDQAISHYRRALQLNPESALAHSNLATLFAQRGQPAQAAPHFRRALQIDPTSADTHNNFAVMLRSQGNLDQAAQHFRHAAAIAPENPNIRYQLAVTSHAQRQLTPAINEYRQALLLAPDMIQVHAPLALALQTNAQPAQALTHYRAALRHSPDQPDLLNGIAWILATSPDPTLRDPDQAILFAQRADDATDHKDPAILDTLAAAYAAAGRFDQAVTTAQTATDLARAAQADQLAHQITQHLKRYQQAQPYYQPHAPPDTR